MAKYEEIRDEDNKLAGYKRSSDGANIPIDNENEDYKNIQKEISRGSSPTKDPDVLAKVKRAKVAEYRTEAVRRIGLQVPEWGNFENIKFLASFWNLLEKKTITTEQTNAVNIYNHAKNTAIPNVKTQTSVTDVQALDVTVGWPV